MLIDFQADHTHACQFEVIDRDTGKPPADAEGHEYGIWRADDVSGTFEYYVVQSRTAHGSPVYAVDPENASRPLSAMKVGRIKIRPRQEPQPKPREEEPNGFRG